MMKRYIYFLFILACFSNLSSSFADDLADNGYDDPKRKIFHVYGDIDLIPTLKIFYDRPRIVVRAVFPQLTTEDVDNQAIPHFNQLVTELVEQEIIEFKNATKLKHKPIPDGKNENDLYIDYDTSVIRSGRNHVISVRFIIKGHITGEPKPHHYYRTLNYDLANDEEIELSTLFKTNSNYLQLLSNYTQEVILKNDNHSMIAGLEPREENYENWNLKANGLLITIEGSQFAPLKSGTQTILIPYVAIRSIISPHSPIARCIKQRHRCVRNDLLTGGFIDEAVNTKNSTLNPILG